MGGFSSSYLVHSVDATGVLEHLGKILSDQGYHKVEESHSGETGPRYRHL